MPKGNPPKTGNDLTQYLRQTSADIRARTGIRDKEDIPVDDAGANANRYYGKNLDSIGKMTVSMFTETEGTGAFKGIPFTARDYAAAYTRMQDTANIDAALKPLSTDAHAEAMSARNDFAGMTFTVLQTQRFVLDSPGTDPAVKAQVKDASGQVNEAISGVRQSRIASRKSNAKARTTESALSSAQQTIQDFQTEQNINNAQKDLKLRYLQDEPLRPEDVVIAPSAPAPAPAPVARPGRRGQARPQTAAAAPKKTTDKQTKPRR